MALGPFSDLAAGGITLCGLGLDGSVVCFRPKGDSERFTTAGVVDLAIADGRFGLRADGSMEQLGRYASRLTPPADAFVQVELTRGQGCGLREDGALRCWSESEVEPPPGAWMQFAMWGDKGCAVSREGQVECWSPGGRTWGTPPPGNYLQVSVGRSLLPPPSPATLSRHLLPPSPFLSTQAYAAFRGSQLNLDDTSDLLEPADLTVFLDTPLEVRR